MHSPFQVQLDYFPLWGESQPHPHPPAFLSPTSLIHRMTLPAGGSEVSRVPDIRPEAPDAPPRMAAAEPEEVTFKAAARAVGLKRPLVSSQPGGSRENVKKK